jgi:hypothetical protein
MQLADDSDNVSVAEAAAYLAGGEPDGAGGCDCEVFVQELESLLGDAEWLRCEAEALGAEARSRSGTEADEPAGAEEPDGAEVQEGGCQAESLSVLSEAEQVVAGALRVQRAAEAFQAEVCARAFGAAEQPAAGAAEPEPAAEPATARHCDADAEGPAQSAPDLAQAGSAGAAEPEPAAEPATARHRDADAEGPAQPAPDLAQAGPAAGAGGEAQAAEPGFPAEPVTARCCDADAEGPAQPAPDWAQAGSAADAGLKVCIGTAGADGKAEASGLLRRITRGASKPRPGAGDLTAATLGEGGDG